MHPERPFDREMVCEEFISADLDFLVAEATSRVPDGM
jgi:hypothetical protein|nr:MAG TPA: hypothetical protein [Caudoviricetes sp.]